MLSEKQIDRINKLISTRVFNYIGGVMSENHMESNIEFKFKLRNYKEMITVGTPTQYLVVDIDIIALNDNLSKLLLGHTFYTHPESWRKTIEYQLYYFFYKISEYISSVMSVFEGKTVPIKIGDIKMSVEEKDTLYWNSPSKT